MTAAAEYLAEFSERFLQELEVVEDEVRRMNEDVESVVRLSVEAYSSYHWFPQFLRFFETREDRISIQIMSGTGREATYQLMNRHLDIAIVSGTGTQSGCKYLPLFTDPLVFICSPDHPLAEKAEICARDIEGERFITYTKIPEPDREFAKLFRAEGRYPRWTATVEIPEAIVELVAAGHGTSVLAAWAVAPFAKSRRIRTLPLGPKPINVIWRCQLRDDEPEAGPVAKVAQALEEWFKEGTCS